MNTLFPVFLKLDKIQTLLVGGGNVGFEKLSALLRNSPEANITLVAPHIREEIVIMVKNYPKVKLVKRQFQWQDLEDKQLVLLATDDYLLHFKIKLETEKRQILTNVADTPELCDFYLGAVVQKKDLKIAISTNGKSPTFAKRMKEILAENIPEEDLQQLLEHLQKVRAKLKGDFQEKIKKLNAITALLAEENTPEN